MNSVETTESSCGGEEVRPALVLAQCALPGQVPEATSPGMPSTPGLEAERLLAACLWTYECRILYSVGSCFEFVLSGDAAENASTVLAECHVEEHRQESPEKPGQADVGGDAEAAEASANWTVTLRRTAGTLSLQSMVVIPEHDSAALPCEVIRASDDELTVRYRRDAAPGDQGALCIRVPGINALQDECITAGVRMDGAPMQRFATPATPQLERADAIRIDRLPLSGGPGRSMEQSLRTMFELLFQHSAASPGGGSGGGRLVAAARTGAAQTPDAHHVRFQCDYRYYPTDPAGDDTGLEVRIPVMLGNFESIAYAQFVPQCAEQVALWSRRAAVRPDAMFVFGLAVFGRTNAGPAVLQLTELLLPVNAELDLN